MHFAKKKRFPWLRTVFLLTSLLWSLKTHKELLYSKLKGIGLLDKVVEVVIAFWTFVSYGYSSSSANVEECRVFIKLCVECTKKIWGVTGMVESELEKQVSAN